MRLALRWKIALGFTLLAAVALLSLDTYLRGAVMDNSAEQAHESLLAQSRLAARLLPPPPWRSGQKADQALRDLDALAGARLTLLGPDGTVIADSRQAASTMESHASRPERLQALKEGTGLAVHTSRTLSVPMLYLAIVVPAQGDAGKWVLRLSRPLDEVQRYSDRLRRVMLVSFGLAILLVWLLSIWLSNRLTVPLQSLVRVARRVSRGDVQARAQVPSDPELAELATTLNSALDSVAGLAETSARQSRHYAAMLEQMGDGVVILDADGNVEFVNPAFSRLLGVERDEVQGRSPEEITLNYDLSALLLRALERNSVQHGQVRLLHPQVRTLATIVTPLVDEQGAATGAIGLLRDLTDLLRLDEVRRDFVANASHELRTPAAGIKALAEALQYGALKDSQKGPQFVAQIVEAADRLTDILNDMLTLTRVERGRELLSPVVLNVREAVAEAVGQLAPAAAARNMSIETEIDPADTVLADAGGLHTILLNLLDNAIKYTPPAGQVVVSGRGTPGGYEIAVSDTGPGIAPEHRDRIFERFYRIDKARDRATGGTGLGLSIVKHLAEAHGGRVRLESAPGAGSTFTVTLPLGAQP